MMHIALCRTTKKSKGIALIQYAEAAGALAAKEEMDGAIFQGRLLHVLPAHRPPPPKQATEVRSHFMPILTNELVPPSP